MPGPTGSPVAVLPGSAYAQPPLGRELREVADPLGPGRGQSVGRGIRLLLEALKPCLALAQ